MRKSAMQRRKELKNLSLLSEKKEYISKIGISSLLNNSGKKVFNEKKSFGFGISMIDKSDFSLKTSDLSMNYLICGATQQGKSYFSVNLLSKLAKDSSLVVLDPHGEMVNELFEILSLSPGFKDRVIYWDINNTDEIIGYNPFGKKNYLTRDKHLDIIKSAILTSWGDISFDQMPRLERWISLGIDVLYSAGLTFREAEYLFSFSETEKRNQILQRCAPEIRDRFDEESIAVIKDPNVSRFIRDFNWLQKQNKNVQYQEIGSSYNRIFKFIYSDIAKNIFGQTDNTIDLRDIIDNKKILLINLRSVNAGKDFSQLLASLIMNEIYSLMNIRLEKFGKDGCQKRKCFVVADEFSSIANNTITKSLSETNKAGIYWILITQFLGQIEHIDDRALDDVLTNCKGKIVFGGMTMNDCNLLSEQLFAGQLNLKEVKNYVDTYIPNPTLVKLIDKSFAKGKNWSKNITKTVTNGSSSVSSSAYTTSNSNSSGHSHRLDSDDYIYNENSSFSAQSSESNSHGENHSEALAEGNAEGGSATETIIEKNSYVTFYEKETIPGQFYSLDEQKHRAASILHVLPKGCAVVKVGNSNPALPIMISSRKNLSIVSNENFLKYMYKKNQCYISFSEAKKNIEDRHNSIFYMTVNNNSANGNNDFNNDNFPLI